MQLASEGDVVGEAIEAAALLVPALPIPQDGFSSGGVDIRRAPGEPDLYVMKAPPPASAQAAAEVDPDDLPPDIQDLLKRADLRGEQFVFGLVDGTLVRATSIKAAKQAASTKLTDPALPGAVALHYPLDSSDVGLALSEGGGVTLTVVDAGLQATTTSLRLHLTAGL